MSNEEQTPVVVRKRQVEENTENAVQEAAAPPQEPTQAEPPQEAPAPEVAASQPEAEASSGRRVFDPSTEPRVEARPEPTPQESPEASEEEYQAQEAEFAAMMAADERNKRSHEAYFEPGQKVQGQVVLLGDENVFVNLGARIEGVISRKELQNEEGELTVAVGDEISAYVVKATASYIELGKTFAARSEGHDALEQAFAAGLPVEGKVMSTNKGGYEITVMGQRAFCPMSQIDMDFTHEPEVHVGQTYRFKISRFEAQGKNLNLVVSRSELQRAERAEQAEETLRTLEAGQEREGVVRRLAKFGAFVDLGGVDGLVHISEMGWGRVSDPSEVVNVGDSVKVRVLDIQNREAGPEKMRISLSMKSPQDDPWSEAVEKYDRGSVHTGEVVRLEQYGAFVQLEPGVDGLVHVSELSLARVSRPRDVVQVGQSVQVQIKDVDVARQRISLSMKSLLGDPWSRVHENYSEGMEIEGRIENVEGFGVFVNLEPGLTGLIPLSELGTERGREPQADFRVGDTATARILTIDQERRRLTLTRKSDEERQQRSAPRREERGGENRGGDRGGNRGGERRPEKRGQERERATRAYRESASMGTFADLFPAKLRGGRKNKD